MIKIIKFTAIMALMLIFSVIFSQGVTAEVNGKTVDVMFLHDTHSHLNEFSTVEDEKSQVLARNFFLHVEKEAAVGKGVEHVFEALLLTLNEFGEAGVGHDVDVFVHAACAHILARHLLVALPLFVAEVERRHLVVGIVAGFEYCLAKIEERGIAVNLYFADETVHFVGDEFYAVEHLFFLG